MTAQARKPILCLDFDGVLHSYVSGWKGADVIPDPPVSGAIEFLAEAVKHFEVVIFSSRSNQAGGRAAMDAWLIRHVKALAVGPEDWCPEWVFFIKYPTEKPPALVTIDDRAICFTGEWPSMTDLANFKPWNKKETQ